MRIIAVIAVLLLCGMSAWGTSITGLYTTGVNDSGITLGSGAADPHYSVLSPAGAGIVINSANIPGTWVPNDSTSRWIWQTATGQPTDVTRDFRISFDLTGLIPASASISGTWSTDNTGLDIFLNGSSTGNTCGGFTGFCNFSVTSGFIAGINTLDFRVNDYGVISGLRVGSILGTAAPSTTVPEPGSMSLVFATFIPAAILILRRRSRPNR